MRIRWLYSVLTLWAIQAAFGAKAPLCEDLDSTACLLFQAKMPNLCTDPALSVSCKRFCGLCPLVCHDCPTAVNSSTDCPDTKACAADELCMLKEHSVSRVGKEFIMTCEKKTTCDGISQGFHIIGKRDLGESRDKRDLNFHCCDTDLCNYPAEFTTHVPTTPIPTVTQTTVPTTTVYVKPVHNCSRDVVFLLDGSSTIGYYNHLYLKQFVQLVVNHIRIGPLDSQVAMVEYSNVARVEWYLPDHRSRSDLHAAISQVPYVSGSTATHAGFWLIRNSVFTAKHGDRSNAKDVVVVVSDGGTDEPDLAQSEAKALHSAGVDIIVVGIGAAASHDVMRKFAMPTSNYFHAANTKELYNLAYSVAARLCA